MIVKKTWRNRLTALIRTANRYSHASPDIILNAGSSAFDRASEYIWVGVGRRFLVRSQKRIGHKKALKLDLSSLSRRRRSSTKIRVVVEAGAECSIGSYHGV